MLERLTASLFCDHATFMGYINTHNHLFDCEKDYLENKEKVKRSCLNEKRFIFKKTKKVKKNGGKKKNIFFKKTKKSKKKRG